MGGGIRDPRLPQFAVTAPFQSKKLTVVVDAGTRIYPDGALAQVEGSALWGLSMALYEGTEFIKGQVRTRTSTATRRCASMTCLISTSNSSTAPMPRSVSASWYDGRCAHHRQCHFCRNRDSVAPPSNQVGSRARGTRVAEMSVTLPTFASAHANRKSRTASPSGD